MGLAKRDLRRRTLHLAALAYATDRAFLSTAWRPHAGKGQQAGASLDHSLWLHDRIDFSDWLDSLKRRDRRVAEFLATGETTTVAARKFKVSAGRISQLRKELAQSWRRFVGEEPGDGAALAA